jgi:hypothetical protein
MLMISDGVCLMPENNGIELFTEHTPPNLEQLFGYQYSRRWVVFFWGKLVARQAAGYCFDGEIFNPLNALAWDTFLGHPLMVAMNHKRINGHTVKRFEFGDALQTSKDCLLLDRRQRRLYAAQKPRALEHLKTELESAEVGNSHSDSVRPPSFLESNGRISSAPTCSLEMIAEMTTWLDNRMALLEKTDQWPKLS